VRGAGGIQRTVMLPLPYWQTLQFWQHSFNLSAFVRAAWFQHRAMGRRWPTGLTQGTVPLKRTTLSLDRQTADDMDMVRNSVPGFNLSRWVAQSLHAAMPQHFPETGY
jgi:hypothetical protein